MGQAVFDGQTGPVKPHKVRLRRSFSMLSQDRLSRIASIANVKMRIQFGCAFDEKTR